MGVYISPNLHREEKYFNLNGDEIDIKTRQVIKPREEPKQPTPEQLAKLEAAIQKQIEREQKGEKPAHWKEVL